MACCVQSPERHPVKALPVFIGLPGSALGRNLARLAASTVVLCTTPAWAQTARSPSGPDPAPDPAPQTWAIHVQGTFVAQGNAGFRAPSQGPNSLASDANGRETTDITLFLGYRPWAGAEIWINPEIDQGFGLSNTLGLAGFPSGEAYKVGKNQPYLRLQRLFVL